MRTLSFIQTHHIIGASYSDSCYKIYQKVANEHYGFSIHLMMMDEFGPKVAAAYSHGLKDAVESMCGDAFEETQAYYCTNQPATCLTSKYKSQP